MFRPSLPADFHHGLLGSIDTNLEKLLAIDVDENRAHALVWKKRGTLLQKTAKVHADLQFEIDNILGTSGDCEQP
jgi:hypothetical protein